MYNYSVALAHRVQHKVLKNTVNMKLIRFIIVTKDLNPTIIYSRTKVYTTCFVTYCDHIYYTSSTCTAWVVCLIKI
jgi:hypothetical protein